MTVHQLQDLYIIFENIYIYKGKQKRSFYHTSAKTFMGPESVQDQSPRLLSLEPQVPIMKDGNMNR